MRTLARFLVLLMFGALCWMGGHWFDVDACNAFLKAKVPSSLPVYDPTKYYRYGGGDGFEDQMNRIRRQGKEELLAEWDKFQTGLWPWDTILKEWREL